MSAFADAIRSLPVLGAAGVDAPIFKDLPVAKLEKLRVAAQLYDCVLCEKDKRHTIPAHCNGVKAKGIGEKAKNYLIAYVCSDCHDLIDGRAGKLTKAAKRALWNEAYWLTVWIWFRDGLVVVK